MREKGLLLLLALLACASSAFPHYYGYFKTPPGYQFLWSGYPWDANQYYSWMYVGYRGDWLFTNLLTSESHPPVILMPFFVLLGHLAKVWGSVLALLKGSSPSSAQAIPATFHLARTLLAFFLVYMIDRTARSCRLTGFQRIWIAAFAIFTGGAWPRSTNLAETHVWFSIAQFPNFSASLIAYLGVCTAFARSLEADMRPGAEGRLCEGAGSAPARRAWRTWNPGQSP